MFAVDGRLPRVGGSYDWKDVPVCAEVFSEDRVVRFHDSATLQADLSFCLVEL